MVFLIVKGTTYADEFIYECALEDKVSELTKVCTSMLNSRHLNRLQLHSARDLTPAVCRVDEEKGRAYNALVEELTAVLKDKTSPMVDPNMFVAYWAKLHDATCDAFPSECVHKDGEKAAVDELYKMYENPEIDEDFRLHIYHCRAILDPDYRHHELTNIDTAAMWFCGKEMPRDAQMSKWAGRNNKTKITVKVNKTGSAPSKEPRMDYSDQRQLHEILAKRRAEFAACEEPELRERVAQQAKAALRQHSLQGVASAANGEGRITVSASVVKPIFDKKTETQQDAETQEEKEDEVQKETQQPVAEKKEEAAKQEEKKEEKPVEEVVEKKKQEPKRRVNLLGGLCGDE